MKKQDKRKLWIKIGAITLAALMVLSAGYVAFAAIFGIL